MSGFGDTRPATASSFATTGIMARPAGVAGFLGSSGAGAASFEYTLSLQKGTWNSEHALRRHSPYSIVTPPGWAAKEPAVKPTSGMVGAGVVSAGSIDNSYVPMPLENAWGKAREVSKNERRKPPRKQATDLLCVAKGAHMLPPAQTMRDMDSVRPQYSMMIPLFHPIDPQRNESGFVRSPNIIPGAKPAPVSPMSGYTAASLPQVPPDHALRKLAFDQSLKSTTIPVARTVRAGLDRPTTTQARFIKTAAGLPGGLSLMQAAD